MEICRTKFEQALDLVREGQRIWKEPMYTRVKNYLEHPVIPKDLRTLLEDHSYNKEIIIGRFYYPHLNNIDQLDSFDSSFLNQNMIAISSCYNGDPVVLDLTTGRVGYLNHENIWSTGVQLRSVFKEVAQTFGDFFYQAAKGDHLPMDYYG